MNVFNSLLDILRLVIESCNGKKMERPKRIAFLNIWSEQNKGDFGIVLSSIRYVLDKLGLDAKDVQIDIHVIGIDGQTLARLEPTCFRYLKRFHLYPAPVPYLEFRDSFVRMKPKSEIMRNILLSPLLTLSRHPAAMSLRRADLAVAVGGHYLYSYNPDSLLKEMLTLYMIAFPVLLAKLFRKRVIFLGISVGPYYFRASKWLLERVLRGCRVMAREEITAGYLRDLRLPAATIPDIALYPFLEVGDKARELLAMDKSKINIALTLRNWLFPEIASKAAQEEKRRQYYQTFLRFCTYFANHKDYHFYFVPQVVGPSEAEDDTLLLKALQKEAGGAENLSFLTRELEPWELKTLYVQMDALVATRMHSIIFGLPTPFIGISYMGKKTEGLMKWLQYSEKYTLSISEISFDVLLAKLNDCLANRVALRSHLTSKCAELSHVLTRTGLE